MARGEGQGGAEGSMVAEAVISARNGVASLKLRRGQKREQLCLIINKGKFRAQKGR